MMNQSRCTQARGSISACTAWGHTNCFTVLLNPQPFSKWFLNDLLYYVSLAWPACWWFGPRWIVQVVHSKYHLIKETAICEGPSRNAGTGMQLWAQEQLYCCHSWNLGTTRVPLHCSSRACLGVFSVQKRRLENEDNIWGKKVQKRYWSSRGNRWHKPTWNFPGVTNCWINVDRGPACA